MNLLDLGSENRRSMNNEKLFPIPSPARREFLKERKEFSNWLKGLQKKYKKKVNSKLIKDAFNLSLFAHAGQKREDGSNYINHPIKVAKKLTEEVFSDNETICAALLHDVLEDTHITRNQINSYFGEEVALLVNNVTKMKNIIEKSSNLREENLKKIFILTFSDPRILMIKISDRIHNLSTLNAIKNKARIERIVRESSEFYSPLSSRFGLNNLKQSLDDEIFKILNKDDYEKTKKIIDTFAPKKKRELLNISKKISKEIKKNSPKCIFQILSREKNIHSVWRKKTEQNLNFEEVRDIYAIRIITKTKNDCYQILGSVHNTCRPLQGFFNDYIASPKDNGYQSIHTAITTKLMPFIELQIRTEKMHEVCEWGEAAHWIYKKTNLSPKIEKNLKKMEKIRLQFRLKSKEKTTKSFVNELQKNFFKERIFVYTPKGDKISLPKNSTALDFAFAIHSNLGSKTKKIKINGKDEKLHKKLKIGDEVEIVKSKKVEIKPNWIFKTITTQAKREIKNHLNKLNKKRIQESGKNKFYESVKEKGFHYLDLINEKSIKKSTVLNDFFIEDENDLFYKIGIGTIDIDLLLKELVREKQKIIKEGNFSSQKRDVSLERKIFIFKKIKYKKISICKKTRPIPGDKIIGILKDENIIVKRKTNENSKKFIQIKWNLKEKNLYTSEIILTLLNRKGSLFEVLNTFRKLNINILDSFTKVKSVKPELGYAKYMIEVESLSALNSILNNLKNLECVIEARRSMDQ